MISLASDLQSSINPGTLLAELDQDPYAWQVEALDPKWLRTLILAPRQAGKSSVSAGDTHHSSRYYPGSLNIIVSPSEQQSKETMKKVDDLIKKDVNAVLVGDAINEKTYINGSRIIALPGTERSVRGYSKPRRLILDEASRIEDPTYKATRPYFVDNPMGKIIAVTTPWGKKGWFYEAWTESKNWRKILVKTGFKLDENEREVIPDKDEILFKREWALAGVSAYYSPRHTREFLQEELDEMGPWWWRQEYGCEFLDTGHSLIDMNAVRDAVEHNTELMFRPGDFLTDESAMRFE